MKNNVFCVQARQTCNRQCPPPLPIPPLPLSSVCIILSLCFMWQLWQHQMLLGDTKQKHENMAETISKLFSSSDRQPHNYFHINVKTPIVNWKLPEKKYFFAYLLCNQPKFSTASEMKWTKGHQNHSEARHPSLSRWVSIWQKNTLPNPILCLNSFFSPSLQLNLTIQSWNLKHHKFMHATSNAKLGDVVHLFP